MRTSDADAPSLTNDHATRERSRRRERTRFVVAFLGLLALFQTTYTLLIAPSAFFAWHQSSNAAAGAWILRLFGSNAVAQGNQLEIAGRLLALGRGCDAIQTVGLLACGVLAYPGR